ncbi:unnamed protein product [Bathycoccus prasinos]
MLRSIGRKVFASVGYSDAKSGDVSVAKEEKTGEEIRKESAEVRKQKVYLFTKSRCDGDATMKSILGGKGAGLAAMTNLGLRVPPGATLSVNTCKEYLERGKEIFKGGLEELIFEAADVIGEEVSKIFWRKSTDFVGEELPLLLSVRSGAAASMPGMMDTVLNLGLNDRVVDALTATSFTEESGKRFLYDAYRRLLDLFGDVVFGIPHEDFERKLRKLKELRNAQNDVDLNADDLQSLCESYKDVYDAHDKTFPQDPEEQLMLTIEAVFKSWNNPRARVYREVTKTTGLAGTAVNIQAMMYGNLNDKSLSGVCFTRSPATGDDTIYGEWLQSSQGEDVVAGIRTPEQIEDMAKFGFGDALEELKEACDVLEKAYKNMMDVEFTVEDNVLYILQCRVGKRTGIAALKIATDLVEKNNLISPRDAVAKYVNVEHIEQVIHPTFRRPTFTSLGGGIDSWNVLAEGLAASPGCASGRIAFTSADAIKMHKFGQKVILVREEASAEDVGGMHASEGFLTARGGMTSHAAVVARGWGKPCVSGTKSMHFVDHEYHVAPHPRVEHIDLTTHPDALEPTDTPRTIVERSVVFEEYPDVSFRKGDFISIDGTRGEVIEGEKELEPLGTAVKDNKALMDFMEWVDDIPSETVVYANCDTEKEIRFAMETFGAKGVGLCRTEHMFLASPDRVRCVRQLFLASDEDARAKALADIEPILRYDFANLLHAVGHEKSITIRLLDPPVHEFLPKDTELDDPEILEEITKYCGVSETTLRAKIAKLRETNPMLGNRGCRLGISHPGMTPMTTRAIAHAYYDAHEKTGIQPVVKIMIPLVATVSEYLQQVHIIDCEMHAAYLARRHTLRFAKEHFEIRLAKEREYELDYHPFKVGCMLETPRSCLIAKNLIDIEDVGEENFPLRASFFSLGTNDLTQMTFGYSRDDSSFFQAYEREKVALVDPFEILDWDGVGKLIKIALHEITTKEEEEEETDKDETGAKSRLRLRRLAEVSACGEHAGNPKSIEFFVRNKIDVVSCSAFRVLGARLAVAKAQIQMEEDEESRDLTLAQEETEEDYNRMEEEAQESGMFIPHMVGTTRRHHQHQQQPPPPNNNPPMPEQQHEQQQHHRQQMPPPHEEQQQHSEQQQQQRMPPPPNVVPEELELELGEEEGHAHQQKPPPPHFDDDGDDAEDDAESFPDDQHEQHEQQQGQQRRQPPPPTTKRGPPPGQQQQQQQQQDDQEKQQEKGKKQRLEQQQQAQQAKEKKKLPTPEKKQLNEYLDHVLEDQPVRRLNVLGTFSDAAGHLERQFLSKASMEAHSKIKEWMADAGLRVFTDAAGNIHGVLDATMPPSLDEHGEKMIRKEMFVGSHLDTVIDGGMFDGALGVVVAIAAAKALRRTNPVREYNIHIIGFSDEEGVRFGSTFLGSRAIVGTLPDDVYDVVDKQGATFLQALRNAGLPGTKESITSARLPKQSFGAYVEVHIEQGKVLELGGFPIAAVAGVAGQTRLKVIINGVQGHAGTTPMVARRDSTPAAAEAVLEIEKRCKKGGVGEALPEVMLVCTVGEFQIFPGATNVIGSRTTFSVDIRAQSDRVRKNVVQDVTRKVQLICRARGLECKVQRTHEASGVTMDRRLTKQLEDACDRTTEEMHRRAYDLYMEQQRLQREENDYIDDYNDDFGDFNDDYDGDGDEMRDEDQSDDLFYYSDAQKKKMNSKQRRRTNNKRNRNDRSGFTREPVITRPPTLVSGAGHDALAMADAMPVAMLFVRSKDGKSHSPEEYTSPEDIGMSARVLYRFLQTFTFPEDEENDYVTYYDLP